MNPNSEREECALEALVSGALHTYSAEFSEEEVEQFLASDCKLSTEGQAALERLGDDPLAGVERQAEESHVPELAGEFEAMHRSLSTDDMDEEIKAELARKREEVLRRIQERRDRRGE